METATLKTISANFLGELYAANEGKKTTLPYIIHHLPEASLVKDGEMFQVIVVGGSVFLNVLIKKLGKRLIIVRRDRKDKGPYLTEADLLNTFAEELDPTVKIVAVNFAFALQPVFEKGKLDGILLRGAKEHTLTGMLGKKVGKTIEEYISTTQKRTIQVSIANDTVCLLLSGLTEVTTHNMAGGILGTGMNFAFFLNDRDVVNLEAANFHTFPLTDEEKIFDKTSVMPNEALLEKATSGAYLYRYYNMIVEKEHHDLSPISSTLALDELIERKVPIAQDIAKGILMRSASLVTCLIAAITLFKKQDMVFVMEGSLFWNATGYRAYVKRKLLEIIPQYSVKFVKIEDSPVFGAAKLVA